MYARELLYFVFLHARDIRVGVHTCYTIYVHWYTIILRTYYLHCCIVMNNNEN